MITAKTFRIFLSSTFGDFQAEREALRARVWPILESRCQSHGAAFEVVDLRWGISEAEAMRHDTLRICLDEIALCQRLSPRPNFLMLIGDRYGWRPLPVEIPVEEFELLLTSCSDVDSELLHAWYRRDDNAVPAHFRLLPRDHEGVSARDWNREEALLKGVLHRASTSLGLTPDRMQHYFYSATHQEIVKGALSVSDAGKHVFAFFRDIEGLVDTDEASARFTDLSDGRRDLEAARLRAELRGQLRSVLPESHRFHYQCTWIQNEALPISTDHIDMLCADVEHALLAIIDQEFQAERRNPLDSEIAFHSAFAAERAIGFIGRQLELGQLIAFADTALEGKSDVRTQHNAPLIIHAPGGTGKSAFMASALQLLEERHPEAFVIRRFVGASPESVNLIQFLEGLLKEISRCYGQPETLPQGGLKELIEELPKRLAWATPQRPLILGIDALDQFTLSIETRFHRWLPLEIPCGVVSIISMLDGESYQMACRRYPDATQIALPRFTRGEGGELLDALLLADHPAYPGRRRSLTHLQRKVVLDAFERDGRPLYLSMAASIGRQWTSWDSPNFLPSSVEGLVEHIVMGLKEKHGERIIDRALAYLCASRYGLSDIEMRDLLWRDAGVRAEFNQRKNQGQPKVDALPPVIWSRIYSGLAPYLNVQSVDGALLHRFFHRVIAEAVARLTRERGAAVFHEQIADYFGSQPLRFGTSTERRLNRRRLMEQPWQLVAAGLIAEAEALLTEFDFAMAKCEAGKFNDLFEDFQRLGDAISKQGSRYSPVFSEWNSFVRTRGHLLRRGDELWPANRILLQIATEIADQSIVTKAADAWLTKSKVDWVWSRKRNRPSRLEECHLIAVLGGHADSVRKAQLLPDGRILSISDDGTLRLWDSRTGLPLVQMEGHSGSVVGAQWLSGRILSWGVDGDLRLWDGYSGAPILVMGGHRGWVLGVDVSSDGRVISWGEDGSKRVWNLDRGELLFVIEQTGLLGSYATFLENGKILSWSLTDLCLWDGQTGALLCEMRGHKQISNVKKLSNNRVLSWGGIPDTTVCIWDGNTGDALVKMWSNTSATLEVSDAQILTDNRIILLFDDGSFQSWDGLSELYFVEAQINEERRWFTKSLSPDRVLSWTLDGCINLFNAQNGRLLAKIEGSKNCFDEAHLMPDERILLCYKDGTLGLWAWQHSCSIFVIGRHGHRINGVEVFSEGRLLSWSNDGTLRIWDIQAGTKWAALDGPKQTIVGAKVADDGRVLTWSDKGSLQTWDAKTGRPLVRMSRDEIPIHRYYRPGIDANILYDGRILSWGDDNSIRLWNGHNGELLAEMEGHYNGVRGVLFVPSERFVSWSLYQTIHFWDWETGSSVGTIKVGESYSTQIDGVRLLDNGRLVAWSDKELRLFDCANGALLAVMEGHTDKINGIHDGSLGGSLLSWSVDGTLRVWDADGGEELWVSAEHPSSEGGISGVECVGEGIVSWSSDGTLCLWREHKYRYRFVCEMKHPSPTLKNVQIWTGRSILSQCWDGVVCLWDPACGRNVATIHVGDGDTIINDVRFLADGRLTYLSEDGTLSLWDGQSGEFLSSYPQWSWVNKIPDIALTDDIDEIAIAKRFNDVWVCVKDQEILFVEQNAKWSTRWLADDVHLKAVGERCVLEKGQLQFLKIMNT